MKRRPFLQALLAFFGVPVVPRTALASGAVADLIVTGATIHTVDPAFSGARAFAVRGGRFAYVGSRAGAMRLRGPYTRVLDLRGATIVPGLIDAHLHLTSVGLALHEVDLAHVASLDDVVRRVAAFASTSADPWIAGEGWDQNLWPGKAFPTHDTLSAALPDRPVILGRVDGHAIFVNAKAMSIAGITKATPDVPGGQILRDAQGSPTGVFIDNAMRLIDRVVPAPTHEQLLRATQSAIRECHRWGVTAIGEARTSSADLAVFEELGRAGRLDLRNYVRLTDDPELLGSRFAAGPVNGAHGGRLWIRSVKLCADGALGSRGAALLEPYSDDPKNSGLLRTSQAHIQEVSERALLAGFQMSVHAIGDRGNRVVLDAYEAALRAVPRNDHRFRVEHAQVVASGDFARFAQLGLIASMQSSHQISDMGWAQDRLGPDRIRGAYAWRSLLDIGVKIANGTDAPVEAVNSLRTFHSAIARQDEHNRPAGGWYPKQRMSREEALLSMTMWAAHANFQDRVIGSITPGKYADFVIMDRDWMRAPAETIMQTKIMGTYFNGKRVYDAQNPEHLARTTLRPRATRAGCCA